jgi:hypothetical protein
VTCTRCDRPGERRRGLGGDVLCDGCAAHLRRAAGERFDAVLAIGSGIAEPPGSPLLFLTPAELRAQTPVAVNWIWQDYIAKRTVTLLAGKPKAGKSTLAMALARAVANGVEFLGRRTTRTGVVYVSEEAGATLLHKLPLDAPNLHVLTRDNAWPKPAWSDLISAAVAHAQVVGADVLVIDTLAFWAALGAEKEKDAGAAQATMDAVLEAAAQGLAVLIPMHTRKGGGDDGDAVRGSSAFAGTADVILELERQQGTGHGRQRVLAALGRFPQTPGALLIDHDAATDSWRVVGEGFDRHDARAICDREALLERVPAEAPGVTRQELEQEVGSPHRQWAPQMQKLIDEELVVRDGEGRKGDPYRFRRILRNPAAQHPRRNAEEAGSFLLRSRSEQQKEPDTSTNPRRNACAETVALAPPEQDGDHTLVLLSEQESNHDR